MADVELGIKNDEKEYQKYISINQNQEFGQKCQNTRDVVSVEKENEYQRHRFFDIKEITSNYKLPDSLIKCETQNIPADIESGIPKKIIHFYTLFGLVLNIFLQVIKKIDYFFLKNNSFSIYTRNSCCVNLSS